jgi:hypothetical protein
MLKLVDYLGDDRVDGLLGERGVDGLFLQCGLFHRLPVGAPQRGGGPHAGPGTDRGSEPAKFVESPSATPHRGKRCARAIGVVPPRADQVTMRDRKTADRDNQSAVGPARKDRYSTLGIRGLAQRAARGAILVPRP